jgi:hypothetical protein
VVDGELRLVSRHRDVATGTVRRDLTVTCARWLEFASWVADNDGHPARASALLRRAEAFAGESGDATLVGYVLMRRAQRAVELRVADTASALIPTNAALAQTGPRTRALALVRRAQAHAVSGDRSGVRTSLDEANRLLDRGPDDETGATLAGHCTVTYVRAHEAHCNLMLGEPARAATEFQAVLADWPDDQRLDEGLFRAQLAVALLATGTVDAAEAEGLRALALGPPNGLAPDLTTLAPLASAGPSRRTAPSAFLDAWRSAQEAG